SREAILFTRAGDASSAGGSWRRMNTMRGGMCVATVTVLFARLLFAQTTKPAPPPVSFDIGAKVQVKWGGLWRDAVVKNKGNGWTLVNYTPGKMMEWVEPWRIRSVGSKDDAIGYAKPGKSLLKAEPAP